MSAELPPKTRPPRVVLDAGDAEHVYSGAIAEIRADALDGVGAAFEQIEYHLASGRHAAGYFAYELGYAFEPRLAPLLPSARTVPLLWFGIFENGHAPAADDDGCDRSHAGRLRHEWNHAHHAAAFARIHDLIARGDLYQANLSYRARFAFAGDPFALYRALRARSGARHCAFVDDGERQIVSLSPELFFEISPTGIVRTRPMKGTAPRGATAEDDAAARARLVTSEKERAENLMIVDLLRNDLSRIARPGSVVSENLFEVETYPTVHQMVSTVAARLAPGLRVETIVRALFPCGSVTGAPKLRAMEVIREAEASPRGVYCGAVGRFSPDGSAAFNVAIRTLTITGNRGELGIGGAIVYDSQPLAEYEECRLKALFYESARHPLQLIETLRHTPGEGFVRAGRHLARMAGSATALGLPFDRRRVIAALQEAVSGSGEALRVRLLLGEQGELAADAGPVGAPPGQWHFAISPRRVASRDPLLRHKTSRRELHDGEQARLAVACGCDEVLFLNERGEITEGSRSNIFVERGGGLFTPALASGLLDGCLRRELLDEGRCSEAVLMPDDLERADRIFLGNSLRGLIPAVAAER